MSLCVPGTVCLLLPLLMAVLRDVGAQFARHLWSLSKGGDGADLKTERGLMDERDSVLSVCISWSNLAWWHGALTGLYILCRLLVTSLDLRRNDKPLALELQDVFQLNLHGLVLFVVGDVSHKRMLPHPDRFLKLLAYCVVMYTFAFDACPKGLQFSRHFQGSIEAYVVIIVIVALVVYCVFNCTRYYVHRGCGLRYGAAWCACVGYVFACNRTVAWYADPAQFFHFHHQFWGFLLACLFRPPTEVAIVAQALALAVCIHGCSVFGWENLVHYYRTSSVDFVATCKS